VRALAALAPIFALAACGGAGSHTLPSAASRVSVNIVLPHTATSAARRPAFIAPSVRSGTFSVNGGTPQVAELIAGAPGCTTSSSGLTCGVSVLAPVGSDTFAVALYDGANAGGALLGRGTATVTVGGTPNQTVGITIGGVVASVLLSFANPAPAGGSAATLPLTVTALDADGNIILADPYAQAIVLSDSDTSGATQLSATSVTSPAQAVTVAFNGTPSLHVTFSASVPGASIAVQTAVLTPKTASTVDWATFGYDAQRTGYNPNETACCTSIPRALWTRTLASKYLTGEPILAQNVYTPLVAGGAYVDILYVGDNHGDLYALNAATGGILWQKTLASQATQCTDMPDKIFGITGTPLFDRTGNRLYVVDGGGILWAFDPATGNVASGWPANGLSVVTDPTLDHVYGGLNLDTVHRIMPVPTASYCDDGQWNGALRFVNVDTATVVSTFTFAAPPQWGSGMWGMGGTSLDPTTGDIIGASGNAEPNEIAPYSDSVIRWTTGTFAVAATAESTNNVGDDDYGAIPSLFPAPDGTLCAGVEGKSGIFEIFNSADIGAGPTTPVQMGPANSSDYNSATPSYSPVTGKAYITTGLVGSPGFRPGVYAFTVHAGCTISGTPDWGVPLSSGSNIFSPLTTTAAAVYVGVGDMVYARSAATGSPLWSARVGNANLYAGIAIADGMMFVSSWGGTVSAFGASTTDQSSARRAIRN
jgi:hypothetical protein